MRLVLSWQYIIIRVHGADDITKLTRLGEDGWEGFAAIAFTGMAGAAIFLKRPGDPVIPGVAVPPKPW